MMTKSRCIMVLVLASFVTVATGCGPRFVLNGSDGKPSQVVVSAYTQDGCMENLKEYSLEMHLMTNLTKVDSDLGWEILLFPFYKGYKCTGTVTGVSNSPSMK